MNRPPMNPVTTWAILLALTGLSYLSWLVPWAGPRLTGSAVIIIALVKASLIGTRFMELREAIWPLRLAFQLWLLAVGGLLVAMFALAP